MDHSMAFINQKTGKVVAFQLDYYRKAEDGEVDLSKYADWEQDIFHQAIDVVENEENYISLPTKYDINDYDIMERFYLSQDDQDLQDELCYAIRGSGSFRRFKDMICYYGIEEKWNTYRKHALR